jgi:hypothetical protein
VRTLYIAVLVLAGCAAARPIPVEVKGVDEGMAFSFWRLRSDLEARIADELAERLPDRPGLRARFELLDASFGAGRDEAARPQRVSITYRFVLSDATGKTLVDVSEQVLLDEGRLLSPRARLYYLFGRVIGRIGNAVAGAG